MVQIVYLDNIILQSGRIKPRTDGDLVHFTASIPVKDNLEIYKNVKYPVNEKYLYRYVALLFYGERYNKCPH